MYSHYYLVLWTACTPSRMLGFLQEKEGREEEREGGRKEGMKEREGEEKGGEGRKIWINF